MKIMAGRSMLIAAAVLGATCGGQDPSEIQEDVALVAFESCSAMEAHIKSQAIRQMNATIDHLVRSYTDRGRGISGDEIAVAAPSPVGPSAQEFTTTNTQEKDVDEADFVKNDGSRIFVLNDRQLLAVRAWPPESARLESATPIEGYPREMFLDENRLVVFSEVSLGAVFQRAGLPWPPRAFSVQGLNSDFAPACYHCPQYHDGLKVTVLDVTSLQPEVLSEQYLQGRYLTSRRVGRSVRVVSTSALRGPLVSYWPSAVKWESESSVRAAFERLRQRNLEAIRASTLEQWLPYFTAGSGGGDFRDLVGDCGDFRASTAPVPLALTSVSTLDLDRPRRAVAFEHILSDADAAYASKGALYLAVRHNWLGNPGRARDHTYIHRLDTSDPLRTQYAASGGVSGHIVNQFAMDEEKGHLRIATTSGGTTSTSNVFVLSAQGPRLHAVGEVTGLAPGERIYSARFEGDRGYVVTFRQVDPLFVLDLSAPAHPRVAGELKIPGFSTYIHPLGQGHLLTIGREAIDTGGGFSLLQEISLQVFDVTSPADPRLVHKNVFGRRSSSSEALYDHKAFNFFASRGLLAIPFVDYSPRRRSLESSLEVFRVTLPDGIALLGSVDHADLARPTAYGGYPWPWSPEVRRSVMMEDFVYSISTGGLKVSPVGNLLSTVSTVPFPDPLPWTAGR
jgi:hypothetical protein